MLKLDRGDPLMEFHMYHGSYQVSWTKEASVLSRTVCYFWFFFFDALISDQKATFGFEV